MTPAYHCVIEPLPFPNHSWSLVVNNIQIPNTDVLILTLPNSHYQPIAAPDHSPRDYSTTSHISQCYKCAHCHRPPTPSPRQTPNSRTTPVCPWGLARVRTPIHVRCCHTAPENGPDIRGTDMRLRMTVWLMLFLLPSRGYFPLHEDPASRVRHTHPFQLDTIQARRQSIQHATAESGSSPTAAMSSSVSQAQSVGNMTTSRSSQFTFTRSPEPVKSASHTPVSSYLPIGVHETAALPMGKYYPTNYENSMSAKQRQRPMPPKSNLATSIKSEPQVPKYRSEPSHTRTGSEVRRRLLQYQRDMIAQATVAATAVLEKSGSAVDPNALAAGSALKKIGLGGTMLKTHKPLSPRLAPLGSPGPVTPMNLEAPGDSYLTHKTVPSTSQASTPEASTTSAEKAKQYQNGTHSPASELHASSF